MIMAWRNPLRISLKKLFVVACLLASTMYSANSLAIIGIDLGTNYMKVGVVRPGRSFEIVLNEASKRKSETILSIFEGERQYGKNAFGMYTRKPKSTFMRLRDLIGRSADHPALRNLEKHGYLYDVVVGDDFDGFKLKFDPQTEGADRDLFRVEELIAMILQYAKRIAEDYSETNVKDAVITVPSYFGQFEREALLDAAEIAGLNVLTLVDENAAASLQHGVYKEFPNTTSTYLVYNMGAASTQVAIVDFWGKPMKKAKNLTQLAVRSKAWDETLGGSEFDLRVAGYLADKFDEQNNLSGEQSIRHQERAMARLRKEAIKVKEVLSANLDMPISIQSLHKDIDLFTSMSRSTLEDMSSDLFERLTKPIDEALEKAGLEITDLDAVEIIGGSVRIPKVKEILSKYFKDESSEIELELGQHLNGDEAMALGAVFMGANLSKGFRVRNVGFTDITSFPVSIELGNIDADDSEEAWNKHALIFKNNNTLNARKVVSFQHDQEISCLLIDKENDVPLAQYDVRGVVEAASKYAHLGTPKVSLTFSLSLNGTAELVKAEAIIVENLTESVKNEEPEENATESTPPEKNAEENTSEDETPTGSSEETSSKDSESASAEKGDDKSEEASGEAEDETKTNDSSTASKTKKKKSAGPTKKTHRMKLKISRQDKGVPKGLSDGEKAEGRKLLEQWKKMEAEKELHEQEKNSLESFVFSCRDKLRSNEDDVAAVTSADIVEKLFEDLEEVEDWLYEEEGENAEISVYKAKKSELSKRINKIFNRIGEMVQLPLTVKAARELIVAVETQISNWTVERPWVSEEEIGLLETQVRTFSTWLDENEEEQKALSPKDDPILTSSSIVNQLEKINFMVEQILKRKKPRPKKPKLNKTKVEKEDEKGEEGEGTDENTSNDSEEPTTDDVDEKVEEHEVEEEVVEEEEKHDEL